MKIGFLIISSFIIFSCNSNEKLKTAQTKGVEIKKNENISVNLKKTTVKRGEKVKLYVYSEHSVFDLLFDTISAKEFNANCKKDEKAKVKIRRTLKVIDIPTALQTYQFNHYDVNSTKSGDRGYEFVNYNPSTKLYTLYHHFLNDDFEFSKLVLIDSLTDYQYEFESDDDFALETPVFSQKNSFFATFNNDLFKDNGSTIAIFKINNKENPKSYFSLKCKYTSPEFNIESICWKNDSTLLLKCFKIIEENDEMKKEVFYLKTLIK